MLAIVDRRFCAIVSEKMNAVCIRLLYSASVKKCPVRKECIVVARAKCAQKSELSTGATLKSDAFPLLMRACRNAFVDNVEDMCGSTALTAKDLDAMDEHGRFIGLDKLHVRTKELAADASTDKLLSALKSFRTLNTISFAQHKAAPRMQNCLVANAHKFGVSLKIDVCGGDGCPLDEESLVEYSFGACDDNCAACERRLCLSGSALGSNFLKRWIEVRFIVRLTPRSILTVVNSSMIQYSVQFQISVTGKTASPG